MNKNYRVEFRVPSPDEIRALERDARLLQARAIQQGLLAVARGVAWLGRRIWSVLSEVARMFSEARAAKRRYQALSRRSDRELAGMGLTRADIRAVVAGTFRREPDAAVNTSHDVRTRDPSPAIAEPRYREAA
jgi:uncharacterized protein YjiS (DUF1127 family)